MTVSVEEHVRKLLAKTFGKPEPVEEPKPKRRKRVSEPVPVDDENVTPDVVD